jgi:hypothetical protein
MCSNSALRLLINTNFPPSVPPIPRIILRISAACSNPTNPANTPKHRYQQVEGCAQTAGGCQTHSDNKVRSENQTMPTWGSRICFEYRRYSDCEKPEIIAEPLLVIHLMMIFNIS